VYGRVEEKNKTPGCASKGEVSSKVKRRREHAPDAIRLAQKKDIPKEPIKLLWSGLAKLQIERPRKKRPAAKRGTLG